jgi:hypothetical protein
LTATPLADCAAPSAGTSSRRAWTAVAVLAVVGVFNYVDRLLPGFLAEPIKRDLQLSDTMLGLINGFGFLLLYAFHSGDPTCARRAAPPPPHHCAWRQWLWKLPAT